MTREIDVATADAMVGTSLRAVRLVEMEFGSGPLRLWTGEGTLRWRGVDWFTAVNALGRMGPIEETAEVRAVGVEFTVSGLSPDVIEIAQGEAFQGRPITAWIAAIDQGGVLVGEPVRIFRGRMDSLDWSEGKTTAFRLQAESSLADLERARVRRFTDGDLRSAFPDDRGGEYIAAMPGAVLAFGRED